MTQLGEMHLMSASVPAHECLTSDSDR